MRMAKIIASLLLISLPFVLSTLGVDMSQEECQSMTTSDWSCLVNNGYSFAIIQTFQGGYGYNTGIGTCVNDAWAAGMKHVDVYIFMCPNCAGNNPPYQTTQTVIYSLRNESVKFGMLWFDIEQCDGCWNDLSGNCNWMQQAVQGAADLGVNLGIYSSDYEWGATVGSCSAFSSKYPLWYAHYDQDPSFDDSWAWEFGGWTSPAIKQFWDHGPNCGPDVDQNYYPSS